MRALLVVAALLGTATAAAAGDAHTDVRTRETALAATIDLEFRDAMQNGVGGAVVLEQDGIVSLRAGYGYADVSQTTPFTTVVRVPIGFAVALSQSNASPEDAYNWYRSEHFDRTGTHPGGWDIRKDTSGHLVQLSRKQRNDAFLSYFCWRPDDGIFLSFVANGSEKADDTLLNRIMTSIRDAGKMPVTNLR